MKLFRAEDDVLPLRNLFARYFNKVAMRSESKTKVILTSINIRFGGHVHGLGGRELESQEFRLDIPFQNRLGNGILPDNLRGPDITISDIRVEKPFELLDTAPRLPVDVAYMKSRIFSLKIKAPAANYSGPLTISFGTESGENIKVDIEKVVLVDGGRSVDLENSTEAMTIRKSQIFRRAIQLYKILSYGRRVNGIEVNRPFSIAETTPKPPFTVDKKDSYIVTLFIKCPDFDYAGPLEIIFK